MSLLQACQAGDAAAWRQLFEERSTQIYRWAVLLGLNATEAEDAAQDVLATACRRVHKCRADEALGTWLYQITRRVVANRRRLVWLRRVSARGDGSDPAFETTAGRAPDLELAVRRCLGQLPRAQAEVLMLMDVEGFTRQEAAEALGMREGTVASRLRTARERFRELWERGAAATGGAVSEAVG